MDLENELTCSVSTTTAFLGHNKLTSPDLYRHPLPTPNPPRLPTHLLRQLLTGVVRMASPIR